MYVQPPEIQLVKADVVRLQFRTNLSLMQAPVCRS